MRALFLRLVRSRSVVSGALLYISMRWFDRLVGVVSTIVLARLLAPDDFGVVALASVALGLAAVMLDFGIHIAVVQRRHLDQDDIDTAWTLRLLQNAAIAAILVAAAHSISIHFEDHRLEPVVIVLALAYLLDGLTGMGPVVFQKRQEYAREVAFFMTRRAVSFVATMLLAAWLRDYWALVFGTVAGSATGVALSYAMHRVPPRLTLARWRHFIGASLWLTLHSIGGYVAHQLDKLVVARRAGTSMLGAYSIADQISAMPTSELLAPINRALFPALAAIQDDPARLRQVFLSALGVQATLALPVAIGLALVSSDLVAVMLGGNWSEAAPLMAVLALAYGMNSLTHSSVYLLHSLAHYRALALIRWATVVAFALLVFVAFPVSDAVRIAWFRTAIAGGSVAVIAWMTMRSLPLVSMVDMARTVARPVVATLAMATSLNWLARSADGLASWERLVISVATGVATYGLSLALLWRLAGRPDGAERWVLDRLGAALTSIRAG